jgi:hypothetical protein
MQPELDCAWRDGSDVASGLESVCYLDERVAALRLTIQNAGRAAREELGLPAN